MLIVLSLLTIEEKYSTTYRKKAGCSLQIMMTIQISVHAMHNYNTRMRMSFTWSIDTCKQVRFVVHLQSSV